MVEGMTIEALRVMAQQAGLDLSEEEMQRVLLGVNRAKKQAAELREIVAAADEPTVTFKSLKRAGK